MHFEVKKTSPLSYSNKNRSSSDSKSKGPTSKISRSLEHPRDLNINLSPVVLDPEKTSVKEMISLSSRDNKAKLYKSRTQTSDILISMDQLKSDKPCD